MIARTCRDIFLHFCKICSKTIVGHRRNTEFILSNLGHTICVVAPTCRKHIEIDLLFMIIFDAELTENQGSNHRCRYRMTYRTNVKYDTYRMTKL